MFVRFCSLMLGAIALLVGVVVGATSKHTFGGMHRGCMFMVVHYL